MGHGGAPRRLTIHDHITTDIGRVGDDHMFEQCAPARLIFAYLDADIAMLATCTEQARQLTTPFSSRARPSRQSNLPAQKRTSSSHLLFYTKAL
jgi:hypothetical protein